MSDGRGRVWVDDAPHLKEIANRLRKLSYRDMLTLCSLLSHDLNLRHDPKVSPTELAEAMLLAADAISEGTLE